MFDPRSVLLAALLVGLSLAESNEEDYPARYLKLPECIASLVILPHIKQKINVWPNTDLLVGVGFPIELTVTAPNPPLRPIPYPPPPPLRPLPPFIRPITKSHDQHSYENSYSRENSAEENYIPHERSERSAEPPIPLNILQRLQLYKTISMSLTKVGSAGGENCVQRAICEAAMTPSANDEILVGELINVILRVPDNDLAVMKDYNEAQRLGKVQRNCTRYSSCPLSIFTTGLFYRPEAKTDRVPND